MSSVRKVFSNSLIYGLSSLISGGIVFLMMPVYTRVLDPAVYGSYSIIISLASLLAIPCTLGIDNAIAKFHFTLEGRERERFNGTAIITILFFSVFFIGIYILLRDIVISRYLAPGIPFFPLVILGIGIAVLKPIYSTFLSMLQVRQRALHYLINSVLFLTTNVSLNLIFLFLFNMGVTALLLGTFITGVMFFVSSLFGMIRRKYIILSFDRAHFASGMKYSTPLLFGPLIGTLSLYLIKLFIESSIGIFHVGIYDIAIQFILIIDVVQLAINRAFFPFSYECFKKNETKRVAEVAKTLIIGYVLLSAVIAVFSKEIIFIFSGPEYQDAWLILPIVAAAACIRSLSYIYDSNILYNMKGPKFVLIANVVSSVVFVTFAALMLPHIGLYAPAIGLLLQYITKTVLGCIFAKKLQFVGYQEGKLLLYFLFAAILSAVSLAGNYFFDLNAFHLWNTFMKIGIILVITAILGISQKENIKKALEYLKNKKRSKAEQRANSDSAKDGKSIEKTKNENESPEND